MLSTITESSEEYSHNTRLYTFARIMKDLAIASKGQRFRKRQQSLANLRGTICTSDVPCQSEFFYHSPGANISIPSTGYVSPRAQNNHHRIDSLTCPELVDSLAFFTPNDSEHGLFNEDPSDELATLISNYEKGSYDYFDVPFSQ